MTVTTMQVISYGDEGKTYCGICGKLAAQEGDGPWLHGPQRPSDESESVEVPPGLSADLKAFYVALGSRQDANRSLRYNARGESDRTTMFYDGRVDILGEIRKDFRKILAEHGIVPATHDEEDT